MFGPPERVNAPSTCPWVDHPASGLLQPTDALFTLAFAAAPGISLNLAGCNNSSAHSSIGMQSPCGLRHIGLLPLVSNWFQILFHSPSGVLFTFPSRYLFTIGRQSI